jgi:hypothetical protein
VRHIRNIVKYQKIRGHNRRQKQIKRWVDSDSNLHLDRLEKYKYWKSDVFVHPWCDISIINSQFPEPKRKTRNQILLSLERIYDSWKSELDKLNKSYYLKIWIYESRISKSQVVCAVNERIEYYENLFIETKSKPPHFINKLSSEFKWTSAPDEDIYWESDLNSPLEMYVDEESFNYDRKLLNKLIKNKVRKKTIKTDGIDDTIFFIPKGKVWIGEK